MDFFVKSRCIGKFNEGGIVEAGFVFCEFVGLGEDCFIEQVKSFVGVGWD